MRGWLLVAAVVLPGLGFLLLGDPFESRVATWAGSLSGWPLAGAVAAALSADLLLPIPSSVLLAYAGRELGVVAATLAGAAGLTVSCEAGYWLARVLGRAFAERSAGGGELSRAERAMTDRAALWLVLSRPLPILAEAATLLAGLGRVPHAVFLPTVAVANVWVAVCFAGLGVAGRDWHPSVLLAASAAIPLGLSWIVRRRLIRETPRPPDP